jgi:hypothetical protein
VSAETDRVEEAVARARQAMEREHYVRVIPGAHLETIARAILEPLPTEEEIQRRVDETVYREVSQLSEHHRIDMAGLRDRHRNAMIDAAEGVDELVAKTGQEAFEKGKRRMRVKFARLNEVVEDLRAARAFVDAVVVWSGDADWKTQALERLDAAIVRYRHDRP